MPVVHNIIPIYITIAISIMIRAATVIGLTIIMTSFAITADFSEFEIEYDNMLLDLPDLDAIDIAALHLAHGADFNRIFKNPDHFNISGNQFERKRQIERLKETISKTADFKYSAGIRYGLYLKKIPVQFIRYRDGLYDFERSRFGACLPVRIDAPNHKFVLRISLHYDASLAYAKEPVGGSCGLGYEVIELSANAMLRGGIVHSLYVDEIDAEKVFLAIEKGKNYADISCYLLHWRTEDESLYNGGHPDDTYCVVFRVNYHNDIIGYWSKTDKIDGGYAQYIDIK